MREVKRLIQSGLFLLLILMVFSCSKENDSLTNGQNSEKSKAIGDKVFPGGQSGQAYASGKFNNLFTKITTSTQFANNTGQNNFAGGQSGNLPGGGGNGGQGGGAGSFTANGISNPLVLGGYFDYYDGWFDLFMINKIPEGPIEDFYDVSGIMFEIISGSTDMITPGEYIFSQSEEPYTFYYGSVAFNANTSQEEYYDIVSGTLNISKTGGNYNISFAGTLDNGSTYSGIYSGSLKNFDEEPEPPPTPVGSMTAIIDGVSWTAEYTSAYDNESSIIISGAKSIYEGISLYLDKSYIYTGAQLSIQYGGIIDANYSSGEVYFTATIATVNITAFNANTISGTFSFEATDFGYGGNQTVVVTNGVFNNIEIISN
ncbi:MAG: hypothetical protein K8R53_10250 [Bacteroidales bacterium]|nr:hypothetical protein [Bacteroidales bacterium]